MKKSDVLDLIKYHIENNDASFRTTAYKIAESFDNSGDIQLAEFILSQLSGYDFLSPQETITLSKTNNFEKYTNEMKNQIDNNESLLLPKSITSDISGIINSIRNNRGLNSFLFYGKPGTGKTQSVFQISRILNIKIKIINFSSIIDSKLGQTSKNLNEIFEELNSLFEPTIVLFDEIDALAMNRMDMNDLREMGRVTTTLMNGLDRINDNIYIFATTNLYNHLDSALTRRFEVKVDFNRYTREDLNDIATSLYKKYFKNNANQSKELNLFNKIINLYEKIPYPADLKNLIKVAFAFSDEDDRYSHLKILYTNILDDIGGKPLSEIKKQGFTYNDLEKITGISISTLSREVKKHE
ncbi:ATP-binding protein (plasmid) [Macrococcoides canis]|uniref:ATP-binding protein n=1 Tax=Macrococcoides canis TaxID=1855823 RepID=UPI001F1A1F22|nr:ATP-binding protein [Macrococcus canis]UJS29008.1 ATP-binding protein [Macrococcus canis]